MAQNEKTVQVKGSVLEKNSNIEHQSSQQSQGNLRKRDTKVLEIRSPMATSRLLSSNLCNISAEYIEAAIRAQVSLLDYYTSVVLIQLNLLENIMSGGFTGGKKLELLKQLVISAAQFWTNLYTLPGKLALGNVLCIK